jgi:hypothetical protein
LVFRVSHDEAERPLTIQRFIERFPDDFDRKALTQVGYSLRDEWGISLEPLAHSETCVPGWHLASKMPLPETLNLSYYEQERAISRLATSTKMRRRTAVEATFDLVLYRACRGGRLLETSFDWTASRTVDGGYLCVGGFGATGMRLVGFSAAVRHAGLGICPTRGLR